MLTITSSCITLGTHSYLQEPVNNPHHPRKDEPYLTPAEEVSPSCSRWCWSEISCESLTSETFGESEIADYALLEWPWTWHTNRFLTPDYTVTYRDSFSSSGAQMYVLNHPPHNTSHHNAPEEFISFQQTLGTNQNTPDLSSKRQCASLWHMTNWSCSRVITRKRSCRSWGEALLSRGHFNMVISISSPTPSL